MPRADEGHIDTFLPNGVRFMLDAEETVKSFGPDWNRETGNQLALALVDLYAPLG
jgi:hypothetical protein